MSQASQYFRNPAAEITYYAAGYIRTDWRTMEATEEELRAIYEHVLRAMRRYQVTDLLFVHGQPQAIPVGVQSWLVANWIPRAIREVDYRRCAVVETAVTRLAARAIGQQLGTVSALEFAYFEDVAAATTWLLR